MSLEEIVKKKRAEIIFLYAPVLKEIIELIEEEIKEIEKGLKVNRFVAKIENKDTPQMQIKSPTSIIDKIKRSKYTIENPFCEFPDIFRDRIICNYLSDAKKINQRLKESEKIAQRFEIVEKKDTIYEKRMKKPTKVKGIRAYYLVFKSKEKPECPKIEIQIMTMLAWAWDKKDHYLIYEPEREKRKVSPVGKIKMNAMSELLYVADEFFDILQREIKEEEW
ncbi:MAG: hypothetical protein AB1422_16190 [bacterium]